MSRLPRVMLDARKLGDGGIGVYIQNLVDGILEWGFDTGLKLVDLTLLVPSNEVLNSLGEQGKFICETLNRWKPHVALVEESAGKYSLSEYLLLPFRQRKALREVDLFHAPHYTLPFFLGVPTVTTVHDIIHVSFPDTWKHSLIGKFLIKSALSRSNRVITVSHASRCEIYRNFGKAVSPIDVVPNAVRREIKPISKEDVHAYLHNKGLLRPYCLFVGNDRPHKRFSLLLEVWANCSRVWKKNDVIPQLIAVGSEFPDSIRTQVSKMGLEEQVKFMTNVSTKELNALYNGAEAVLIPSREEGFGLVALEAFACGTQVIAMPLPSVKEVCASLAYYAADFSPESFYSIVANKLQLKFFAVMDRDLRIKRASLFEKKKVAKLTCSTYYDVLGIKLEENLAREIEVEKLSTATYLGVSSLSSNSEFERNLINGTRTSTLIN